MRFETGLNERFPATGYRVPISLSPVRGKSEEVRSYLYCSLKNPQRHFGTARRRDRKRNYLIADRSAACFEYKTFRLSRRGSRRPQPPFLLAQYKNVPVISNYIRGSNHWHLFCGCAGNEPGLHLGRRTLAHRPEI